MKKLKLKIDNFVENKLENLSIIKGGGDGQVISTGGGNTSGGNGSGEPPPPPPFPFVSPRSGYVAPGGEAPDAY